MRVWILGGFAITAMMLLIIHICYMTDHSTTKAYAFPILFFLVLLFFFFFIPLFSFDQTSDGTGGMYPELITRPDLKVFLPPIGGISVYIFGNPDYISGKIGRCRFGVS